MIRMDLHAFRVTIAPCLCLFSSCLNISKRLLPELTPIAIIGMIIRIKNARIHPADRVLANPHRSLYPIRESLQPSPASKSPLLLKPDDTGSRSDNLTS
jgi:hypothetical protein